MAKAEYKINDEKKDKTLSFRIPNELYKLLKEVSEENNQSVNIFARRLLMDHIYSRFTQAEENLKKLKKDKDNLEAELKQIGPAEGEPDWEKLYEEKLKEIRDIKNNRDKIRNKITNKMQEIDQISLMIERYEEIRLGVKKNKIREIHYLERTFPDDIEKKDDFSDIESEIEMEGETKH